MIIKILGSGCKKCVTLGKNAKTAVAAVDLDVKIVKVTDFAKMAAFGVRSTLGLGVNDKVLSVGQVLTAVETGRLP